MMEEYNVPASTVTYKVLIQSYGNAGHFDMVDELMAFIAEFQHVKLNAFNQLVKTYARASILHCNFRTPFHQSSWVVRLLAMLHLRGLLWRRLFIARSVFEKTYG
jgi:pentatricopeptide repeat protein